EFAGLCARRLALPRRLARALDCFLLRHGDEEAIRLPLCAAAHSAEAVRSPSEAHSAGVHSGTAPAREATTAPSRLAKSPMRALGQPWLSPWRNAAAKASPDPTVSTTCAA